MGFNIAFTDGCGNPADFRLIPNGKPIRDLLEKHFLAFQRIHDPPPPNACRRRSASRPNFTYGEIASIDSTASIMPVLLMPTITIRNLEEQVKQRLRMLAAEHGRSMEAEARDILTRETLVMNQARRGAAPKDRGGRASVCAAVRGAWKGRMGTDEIMAIARGD